MLIGFHAGQAYSSSVPHPHILYKPIHKFYHFQKWFIRSRMAKWLSVRLQIKWFWVRV